MSYRIHYDPGTNHKYPSCKKRKNYIFSYFVIFCILFALIFLTAEYKEKISLRLFAGDPISAESALSSFVSDIRNGVNSREAIATFCREMVSHATE